MGGTRRAIVVGLLVSVGAATPTWLTTAATVSANRSAWSAHADHLPPPPPPPPAVVGQRGPAGPFPYGNTFLLNSKPGSQRTIYLDFNGYDATGSQWGNIVAGGFTVDADPLTYTNAEMDIIQSVWQRVAADYSAFDVNVTTQDPGAAAIDRTNINDQVYGTTLAVTQQYYGLCNQSCGGIAFFDAFDNAVNHQQTQPAWVFANVMFDNAKYIAEAASHEIGHNVGLHHDGLTAPATTYYQGAGMWAPIMGSAYTQPLAQFSKGEYPNANNTENDFTLMAGHGVLARVDDYGNSTGAASAFGASGTTRSGTLGTPTDVDVFSFSAAAGAFSFNAAALPYTNVDAKLELLNSAGTVLFSDDPAAAFVNYDAATGLGAAVSGNLPAAGTYYLRIDGVGNGSPAASGYSDYGSVGGYSIVGTYIAGGDTVKPTAVVTSPVKEALVTRPVTITGTAADNVGVTVVRVIITNAQGQYWTGSTWQAAATTVGASVASPGATSTTWTYTFNPPETEGSYTVTGRSRDAAVNIGNSVPVVFHTDVTNPAATLTAPASLANVTKPVTVSGSATDNVSVFNVQLLIRNAAGSYWAGSTWQTAAVFVSATLATPNATSTTWSYVFSPPEATGTYTVRVRPRDRKGNFVLGAPRTFHVV